MCRATRSEAIHFRIKQGTFRHGRRALECRAKDEYSSAGGTVSRRKSKEETPPTERGFSVRRNLEDGLSENYLPPSPMSLPAPVQKSHPKRAKLPMFRPQLPKMISRKLLCSEDKCL